MILWKPKDHAWTCGNWEIQLKIVEGEERYYVYYEKDTLPATRIRLSLPDAKQWCKNQDQRTK